VVLHLDGVVVAGARVLVVLGRTSLSNGELLVLVALDGRAYVGGLGDFLGGALLLLPDVRALFCSDANGSLLR